MQKQELIARIEKLQGEIETANDYYSRDMRRSGTLYHLDVKMHDRINYANDIEAIAKKYPALKEEILEYWTGTRIQEEWDFMLETEREYLVSDYLQGFCVSSAKYWDEQIEKVSKGEDTSYPYINKHKSIAKRINMLKIWKARDAFIKWGMAAIDTKSIGLYGRSGGHLLFALERNLNDNLECLRDDIESEDSDGNFDIKEAWNQFASIRRYHKSICYTLKQVDAMRKGMNFQEYLEEKVADWVYEKHNEINNEIKSKQQEVKDIEQGKAVKELKKQIKQLQAKVKAIEKQRR